MLELHRWLCLHALPLCLAEKPELDEITLERVLEELETMCYENMNIAIETEEGLGIEYDEDVVCDVCRSPEGEDGNEMVFCDKCNVCVHQVSPGVAALGSLLIPLWYPPPLRSSHPHPSPPLGCCRLLLSFPPGSQVQLQWSGDSSGVLDSWQRENLLYLLSYPQPFITAHRNTQPEVELPIPPYCLVSVILYFMSPRPSICLFFFTPFIEPQWDF